MQRFAQNYKSSNLGTKLLYLNIFVLKFENTTIISEISVKMKCVIIVTKYIIK